MAHAGGGSAHGSCDGCGWRQFWWVPTEGWMGSGSSPQRALGSGLRGSVLDEGVDVRQLDTAVALWTLQQPVYLQHLKNKFGSLM